MLRTQPSEIATYLSSPEFQVDLVRREVDLLEGETGTLPEPNLDTDRAFAADDSCLGWPRFFVTNATDKAESSSSFA